jgi:hypothetical protein
MKTKSTLAILIGAILIFSLLSFTSNLDKNIVIIRLYEACKGCPASVSKIIVQDTDTKVIELEKYEVKSPESNDNLKKFRNVVKQYTDNGYIIESSVSVASTNQEITTYILCN